MALPLDDDVVKAFSPCATQESFADGIGFGRMIRCSQNFNSAPCCHARECLAIFTIAIPNQKARGFTEGRCFAQLLGNPGICGMCRDVEVNDSP